MEDGERDDRAFLMDLTAGSADADEPFTSVLAISFQ
jgi:hypothetical protein